MRSRTVLVLAAALALTLAGCSAAEAETPETVSVEPPQGPSAEEVQAAACAQAETLLAAMGEDPALAQESGGEIGPDAVSAAFEAHSQQFAEGEVAEVFPEAAVSLHDISVGMLDGAEALNADGTGTLQVALKAWADARAQIVESCGIV